MTRDTTIRGGESAAYVSLKSVGTSGACTIDVYTVPWVP